MTLPQPPAGSAKPATSKIFASTWRGKESSLQPMNNQSEQAKEYIKQHKQLLFDKFANPAFCHSARIPSTIFMAGSPGAGKTEFSKNLIERFERHLIEGFVRIDADDIREVIPGYDGSNTDIFKVASFIGVDILYNYVLDNKFNAVIDGTFANYEKAFKNIERALKRKRVVDVFYIYQDPVIAWDFTKKREKLEGRSIPLDFFVDSFFLAKENVNRIKLLFKKEVDLHLVVKDYRNKIENIEIDIEIVDSYLKIGYTKEELREKLSSISI